MTYVTVSFELDNFLHIKSPGKHEDDIDYDADEFSHVDVDDELN